MGKGENKAAEALCPIIDPVKGKVSASTSHWEQVTGTTGVSLGMEEVTVPAHLKPSQGPF